MTILKTRSLALVAAVLLSGCATTNYYGDQSGNYAYDNGYGNQYSSDPPYDQADQYTQYNDQPDVNVDVGVSFDTFERELAPYGNWTYNPRWGDVWQPLARTGFRPYFNGYWANTNEYGWMWVSDDPWDITYHYGRWVYDPRDGWLWVPGYVWGPAWVVWRSGGGQVGWFPMPPDDYYGNGPYNGNYARFYGYRDWYGPNFSNDQFFSLWVFVGEDRFADRNYRNYVMPQRDNSRIMIQTNETTNYVTVNNYIVNRSINVERIERASNRRFAPITARTVMKRETVVIPVETGRQLEQRERRQRPIPAGVARGFDRDRDVPNAQNNGPNGRGPDNGRGRGPRDFQPQNAQGPQDNNQNQPPGQRNLRQERLEAIFGNRVQQPQNANGPQQGQPQQNGQGPQNGNPDRFDRRQERLDERQRAIEERQRAQENRGRFQAPQEVNQPQEGVQPQNVQGPQDNRGPNRARPGGFPPRQGPQNANVPPPAGSVEPAVQRPAFDRPDNNGNGNGNARGNGQVERAVERPAPPAPPAPNNGNGNGNGNGRGNGQVERAVERPAPPAQVERAVERPAPPAQAAVQPAAERPNAAPPGQAADRAAAREERAAERNNRREERRNDR